MNTLIYISLALNLASFLVHAFNGWGAHHRSNRIVCDAAELEKHVYAASATWKSYEQLDPTKAAAAEAQVKHLMQQRTLLQLALRAINVVRNVPELPLPK